MRHDDALPVANRLVALLAPYCEQIEIAGSIRRRKLEVKDIEIVARPRVVSGNLFGDPDTPATNEAIADLIQRGIWQYDPHVKRDGPKYKRFVFAGEFWPRGVAVDLFLVDERNWGSQLAIRTGCFEFSKWFVTSREKGGGMPRRMKHEGGYLTFDGQVLPCPTEAGFFAGIDVPWYEPEERTPELAERLWRMK